jgi:integrase
LKTKRPRYQQGNITKLERLGGFVWKVRFSEWIDGKRHQKSLTFSGSKYPSEMDVRKAIELTVVQMNSGSERARVEGLFGAVIDLYRKDHLPNLEPSTQQTNSYLLKNYIEPKFGKVPIRDVEPLEVIEWFKELQLAPSTKAAIRSVISVCFDLAALHKYIPTMGKNPMTLVKIRGVSKRRKRIAELTVKDFHKLLKTLPEPLNIMVLLDGCLGLRISELVALKWADIDTTVRKIAIQRKFTHGHLGKTKSEASDADLPLANSLLIVLKKWRPKTKGSEWLFPSSRTGGPRSASMLLQKGLQPVAKEIGLGHITWHMLRHACRSWLGSGGTAVGTQKDLLRQADISTTMNIYGHALSVDLRNSHNRLVNRLVPKGIALLK